MRDLDGRSVDVVFDVLGPRAMPAAAALTDLGNPDQAVVLIAAVLAAAALVVPPARLAVVTVVLVGANAGGLLAAGCCERLVDVPLPGGTALPMPASAPSNHTVLAASVGVAAAFVVPWALLGLTTAVALGFVGAMAVSLLLQRTHALSDVVSALLLVGAWTALGAAFEPGLRERLPARAGPLPLRRGRAAVLAVVVLAVSGVLAERGTDQAQTVVAAVSERPRPVLLACALALVAGVALQAVVRPRRRPGAGEPAAG